MYVEPRMWEHQWPTVYVGSIAWYGHLSVHISLSYVHNDRSHHAHPRTLVSLHTPPNSRPPPGPPPTTTTPHDASPKNNLGYLCRVLLPRLQPLCNCNTLPYSIESFTDMLNIRLRGYKSKRVYNSATMFAALLGCAWRPLNVPASSTRVLLFSPDQRMWFFICNCLMKIPCAYSYLLVKVII